MEFKIGDKVRAKQNTPYSTTTMGWEGEVTRIYTIQCQDIEVRGGDGDKYDVESEYFDLISPQKSMEFKVGNKVKCVKDYDDKILIGMKGIIVDITSSSIGIEWEEDVGGHNCNKHCKDRYGYYVQKENIELTSSSGENTLRTIKMRLNSMMKRLLDADTKKLIKGGLINGDLELTEEGRELLTAIMFDEKKDELVRVAEEKIAEEKEENK